jgi:colanic acid/amylovoran biosynthesis protein
MRIVILNTHSVLNPGDSAIVLAELQFLRERYPDLALTITSRTPELDREFYGPLGVNVLPAIIPAPSLYDGWRRKLGMTLANLASLGAKKRLREEIRRSDFIISSGGGYFYSNKKHLPGLTFRQNVAHIGLARRFKKPLIFFPQSFGPLASRTARKSMQRSVSGKNVIKVFAREEASYELVRSLLRPEDAAAKLDLCPDVAFLLRGSKDPASQALLPDLPRPRLLVTLRHWDYPEARGKDEKKRKEEEYLRSCAEVCRRFFERWKGSVMVFPQVKGPGNFEDDRPVSKAFWKRIEGLVPDGHRHFMDDPRVLPPQDVLAAISQADLVLATRAHSAIMALVAGVPVVSVSYQPKGIGTLRLMGLERFGTGIAEIDPQKVGLMVDEILSHPAAVKEEITRNLDVVRKTVRAKLEAALELAD